MKKFLTFPLFCIALACPSSAAVLVHYGMSNAAGPLSGPLFLGPTSMDAGVAASTLTNQAGGQTSGSFVYNGDLVSSWPVAAGATPVNDNSFSAAYAGGNYLTFSISPAPGNLITLSDITFQAATGSNSTTSNRGFFLVSESSPASFSAASTVLLSDRTAFDGGGGGGGTLPVQASPATSTVPRDYSMSLASLAPVTGTQYFRFYLQAPSANQAITFDDIFINGTVSSIPEPSAALLGLASLLVFGKRRRIL